MSFEDLDLDQEVIDFLESQTDFQIDRISQEGGNCDIFFGHHKIFDRRIALKIYYGSAKDSSHYEPRILSKLDHPNILKVRDAKKIANFHNYFMTDEIDGGDLEKYYKAGKLDLKKSLNIIHGILLGLNELHNDKIQIVHRDLKPKNILIKEDTCEPLIADFGSIKHFNNSGKILGSRTTTLYMPPEVIRGDNYTIQSDIYQIGVSMYQILGGFFPDTYAEWLTEKEQKKLKAISGSYEQSVFIDKSIFLQILKNKLLRYESLPIYINKPIRDIIKKAIHPNLKNRYQNVGAFMNDLYKVQKLLTNWFEIDKILFAIKNNGTEFRIINIKGVFYIEKKGSSGWRKTGKSSVDISTLIREIN